MYGATLLVLARSWLVVNPSTWIAPRTATHRGSTRRRGPVSRISSPCAHIGIGLHAHAHGARRWHTPRFRQTRHNDGAPSPCNDELVLITARDGEQRTFCDQSIDQWLIAGTRSAEAGSACHPAPRRAADRTYSFPFCDIAVPGSRPPRAAGEHIPREQLSGQAAQQRCRHTAHPLLLSAARTRLLGSMVAGTWRRTTSLSPYIAAASAAPPLPCPRTAEAVHAPDDERDAGAAALRDTPPPSRRHPRARPPPLVSSLFPSLVKSEHAPLSHRSELGGAPPARLRSRTWYAQDCSGQDVERRPGRHHHRHASYLQGGSWPLGPVPVWLMRHYPTSDHPSLWRTGPSRSSLSPRSAVRDRNLTAGCSVACTL